MTNFAQYHFLVSYPPSNLNRDDTGRPKTALMGGAARIRISSQALKRAWRMSDSVSDALAGNLGTRTRCIGKRVREALAGKVPELLVEKTARAIEGLFRKIKKTDIEASLKAGLKDEKLYNAIIAANGVKLPTGELDSGKLLEAVESVLTENKTPAAAIKKLVTAVKRDIKALAIEAYEGEDEANPAESDAATAKDDKNPNAIIFIGALEMAAIDAIVASVLETKKPPQDDDIKNVLTRIHGSADIAMFGRMLATNPGLNGEAAVEVAHAFTVHKATVEDDYYTAVDDLARREDGEAASGHLDIGYFAAGVYYLYVCINEDLLLKNLNGDADLAALTKKALIEAALTVGPSGKRASFASRARTSYVLAERGSQAPRSLSVAFLSPVRGTDVLVDAITSIETQVKKFDRAYGPLADARYTFDVEGEKGDMSGLLAFAAGEQ